MRGGGTKGHLHPLGSHSHLVKIYKQYSIRLFFTFIRLLLGFTCSRFTEEEADQEDNQG